MWDLRRTRCEFCNRIWHICGNIRIPELKRLVKQNSRKCIRIKEELDDNRFDKWLVVILCLTKTVLIFLWIQPFTNKCYPVNYIVPFFSFGALWNDILELKCSTEWIMRKIGTFQCTWIITFKNKLAYDQNTTILKMLVFFI